MATFVGFNTIGLNQQRTITQSGVNGGVGTITQQPYLNKKFRLTDDQLVIRDFLNAMSIKQGDKVGQPTYGTTLWSYVFEPNTPDIRVKVENEVRRVASQDPRLEIGTLQLYAQDNGFLIEMEIKINPYDSRVQLGFFLNKYDGSIIRIVA